MVDTNIQRGYAPLDICFVVYTFNVYICRVIVRGIH